MKSNFMTLKKGFEMEDNKDNKVETPTTNTPENGGQEQKTFTQEELNTIVETRLAKAKKEELEAKLEKVRGSPREEEFQLQVDKLNALIKHLENE